MTPDHEELADLLPDYALGALGDEERQRVARHLAGCAACRRDLALLLETVGLLTPAAPPAPAVRDALLASAASAAPSQAAAGSPAAPEPPTEPAPARRRRWLRALPRLGRATRLALVAALVALVLALGTWNVALQRQLDERTVIARLVTDPAAAHPLTDSDLDPPASGVIYTDPAGRVALLLAQGLPPLPAGQQYQVWLFTEGGEQISGGLFAVAETGVGQALIRAPAPFSAYWAVGVSAEPAAGSPNPTAPLAIGGWLR